jgi:signal transduction histidine kinase
VDADDMLRDAIAICIANLDRRTARIVQAFSATNVRLQADPARLRQIFWNLLSNAVKFTPPEGTIHVRTRDLKDELQIEVTDTGPGIEPTKLHSVFDAFEQVLPESSAGLGLGLAICKALVELHGGSIEARSLGPGTGASFIVRLPVGGGGEMRLLLLLPSRRRSKLFGSSSWMIARIPPKAYVFCSLAKGMRFALPVAWRRPSGLPQRSSLMF